MKIYEIVVILNISNLISIKNFISSFKYILIYNNFIILNIENWGVLKFRYKIKNEYKGFFLFYRFYSDNLFLKKLVKYLRFNGTVLRFFISFLKEKNYFLNSFCLKKILKKNKNVFKKKKKYKKNKLL